MGSNEKSTETLETLETIEIRSPMVCTVYDCPTDIHNLGTGIRADAYVNLGDRIHPGTIAYAVEAMMVFSECKAGVTGTIEEKLFDSGDKVEFGQVLYKVRPDKREVKK